MTKAQSNLYEEALKQNESLRLEKIDLKDEIFKLKFMVFFSCFLIVVILAMVSVGFI